MAEAEADQSTSNTLLVWGLATFHSALLVSLVVGALFVAGVLGNQLAALDTWVGVIAYGYLWGVTWWTTGRSLDAVGADLLRGDPRRGSVLASAIMWGGVAGLFVFLPAFVVTAVAIAGAGGLGSVPFLALAAAIGAAVSAGVGAAVGGAFAMLDLLFLWLATTWFPPPAMTAGDADPQTTD